MAEKEEMAKNKGNSYGKGHPALWLVLGLVVAAAAAGGGFFAFRYFGVPAPVAAQSGGTAGKTTAGPIEQVRSTMNLEPFLVNLADRESPRFVKATFRLGLDVPSLGEDLEKNPVVLAAARDRIISILSTKTADGVLTLEGKEKLREEIREKVNPVLPEGNIVEVFILDFVVQL